MLDEDELLRQCQAGRPEAQRELFRRYRSDVARLVYRMLGHSRDVEDLTQEAFLQVFRSIRSFRGQSKLSTWIYRVTANAVLMHRRAAKSRPRLVPGTDLRDGEDPSPLPDQALAQRTRLEAFQRILNRISDKKRLVFLLHDVEGMAAAEVAQVVGAPVVTVRTRLFYARRELTQLLEEEPALAQLNLSLLVQPSASDHEQSGVTANPTLEKPTGTHE